MFKVSCIQICSGRDIKKNFNISKKLVLQAIKQKSDFIITPENSSLFGLNKKELMINATSMQKDFYLQGIKKLAKQYRKWILIGSAVIKENDKIKNRSILINDKGKIQTYYDKIHMYDAKLTKKENILSLKFLHLEKQLKQQIYHGEN